MKFIREWLGFWLLDKALRLLPTSSSARAGILRGLREQREYDRYEGYCELEAVVPLPFDCWREVSSTLRIRAAGAEQKNATLATSDSVAHLDSPQAWATQRLSLDLRTPRAECEVTAL